MAEPRAVGGKVAFFKRDHLNNPFVFPPISHFSQEKSPNHKCFRNGKENILAKDLCSTIVLLPGGCKRIVRNTELSINVATMPCLTVKLLYSELPTISSLLSLHFLYSEMCTGMRKPEAHSWKYKSCLAINNCSSRNLNNLKAVIMFSCLTQHYFFLSQSEVTVLLDSPPPPSPPNNQSSYVRF